MKSINKLHNIIIQNEILKYQSVIISGTNSKS